MSLYVGLRKNGGGGSACSVTVDGQPLPLRLDLRRHSPTGFEWGYGGSGPAQLALALLAHHTKSGPLALSLYQAFKWRVVGSLPAEWRLTSEQLDSIVRTMDPEDHRDPRWADKE